MSTDDPRPRPPLLDADLADEVEAVLARALGERRGELARIAPEAAGLVDVLERFLSGGKLLRPRFCFWGGAAVRVPDPEDRRRLWTLGGAIELVQAAALLHDDVIDHSPTRRGRPAVHVAAAREHRERSLRGDSEDHGIGVAIVLGDMALAWAGQLADEAFDADGASAAREQFDLLRTEVMTGQYLDILHQAGGYESRPDAEDAALAVIRWKTVPYTVLRPLLMGAALLGADQRLLADLADYAEAAGRGFQLRDDLLGVVGDEQATGKSASGDILEGKRTVLLARAEASADPAQRGILDAVVGRGDADPVEVAAVRGILRDTGAVRAVAEMVEADGRRALDALVRASDITPEARDGLAALARSATSLEGIAVQ